MEYLSNNITLSIPEGAFPLSTDSILLSDHMLSIISEHIC